LLARLIIIHDTRIAAVGPRESVRVPKSIRTIDCSGKFIAAGFWNSHVHIFTPGLLHVRDTAVAHLNEQLEAMLKRWGFTTVFDIGSVFENTVELRHRIDSGKLRGPHILTTGEPLWTESPSYVLDYLPANHISIPIITTPDAAAARVRAQAQHGANGVKLSPDQCRGR
jgi:imidazolonepropionase-like amidohydrolase